MLDLVAMYCVAVSMFRYNGVDAYDALTAANTIVSAIQWGVYFL